MYTCTDTHICKYTCRDAHTCTDAHYAHMQGHPQAHVQGWTRTCTLHRHTCRNANIHAYTHTHTQGYTHVHTYTCLCTWCKANFATRDVSEKRQHLAWSLRHSPSIQPSPLNFRSQLCSSSTWSIPPVALQPQEKPTLPVSLSPSDHVP